MATLQDLDARTQVAVNTITGDTDGVAEKQLIDLAVLTALCDAGDGTINSYAIADVVFARRRRAGGDPNWEQTKDYVQHLLREAAHVCRHAVNGHMYQIHEAEVCSTECTSRHQHHQAAPVREHCGFCYLELTTDGLCPLGCD